MASADRLAAPLRLGVLLRQAHRKAASALEAALEPLSLSGRHFGVLLHLSQLGESTHTELMALTGGDKASMARTVDALVAAGLVAREVSRTDRRVSRLTLTESGSAVTTDAYARAMTTGSELCNGLSAAELAQLVLLLERFVETKAPGNLTA